MTAITAPRLAVLTRASRLTTRETVAAETPARRAMSRMVREELSGPDRARMDVTKVPTSPSRVKPSPGLPQDLEGQGVRRVPLQEALEDLPPLLRPSRGQVDLGQRDVGVCELGAHLDEFLEEADRFLGLAPGDEDEGQVVRGLPVIVPVGERLAEIMLGALHLAFPAQDEAEVVQGLGKIGLQLQRLLVEGAGFG